MILWSTCIFLCHPAIQRACLGAWGYLLLPAAFLPAACAPTACQTWKALARSVPGNHSLGPIYIFCSQSLNYTSPLCGEQSKRPDCYSFSILLSRFLSCLTFYKDFFAWFQRKFSSTIPPAPEREELFEKLCLCVQLVKPYKCILASKSNSRRAPDCLDFIIWFVFCRSVSHWHESQGPNLWQALDWQTSAIDSPLVLCWGLCQALLCSPTAVKAP